jgi:hypothetical protein
MKATIRLGATLATVVLGLGLVASGCLTRPVVAGVPVTKTNVTIPVPNAAVSKIDMLFDIDNSASMGDKQAYLAQAIPLLIQRLVQPNCIDNSTPPNVVGMSTGGVCTTGKPEFPPVHDMHIGVVTSSLGTRLSDIGISNNMMTPTAPGYILCSPNAVTTEYPNLNAHNDDRGELIMRSEMAGVDGTVADASPNGYLYYLPTGAGTPAGPQAPVTSPTMLEQDFTNLVTGAGIYGCGIESQLESWYRFLIQPDPYDKLVLNQPSTQGGPWQAGWSGVDNTIIQQRHDFLRPDSLVVVVVLSDENDSEIDVRSLQGTGYLFMHEDWPPPHATAACATDPDNGKTCFNCPASGSTDPGCSPSTYTAANDWGFDPNLRHVHMLQKYGVDPQYPIGRYYLGLTSTVVPDRTAEYPVSNGVPAGGYMGCLPSPTNPNECVPNCTNPLFAASLPEAPQGATLTQAELCNLPVGQRSNQKSNIFYAHIGGVPWQLLHFDPNNLANSQLSAPDWKRILGAGAANYMVGNGSTLTHDYTGIDPHMIESYLDRTTLNQSFAVDTGGTNALAPSSGAPAAPDPVNGREWVTDQPAPTGTMDAQGLPIGHVLPVDRQYACIFPIAARDCTLPQNANSCDCPADATGLTPAQIPPLCDPNKPTSQIFAKAYPTIRELTLANLMQGQGIVASLCPIDPTPAAGTTASSDPKYGYNPAVAVIVDRLKSALNSPCLPEKLAPTDDGGTAVPCLVLVALPPSNNGGTCENPKCDPTNGLFGPGQDTGSPGNPPLDQDVLNKFCEAQEQAYLTGGGSPGAVGDPDLQSVCMLYQLTTSDPNSAAEFQGGTCNSYMPPGTTAAGGGGGWCYVTGAAAGACPQAVQFSTNNPPAGSLTHLQCIEQSISVVNASSGM